MAVNLDMDALVRSAHGTLDVLGALVPGILPSDDPFSPTLGLIEAGAGRFYLYQAVFELVRHSATDDPLSIVIEDLHWADEGSGLKQRIGIDSSAGHDIGNAVSLRAVNTVVRNNSHTQAGNAKSPHQFLERKLIKALRIWMLWFFDDPRQFGRRLLIAWRLRCHNALL